MSGCDLDIRRKKMVRQFASSGDPDQMLQSAVPDLGSALLANYPFWGL